MSNTRTALSCSYIDVNNAVNGGGPFPGPALDGDTIIIPAGLQSWNKCLVITKGITLQGQTAFSGAGGRPEDIVLPSDASQTIIQDDSPRNTSPANGLIMVNIAPGQVTLANPFRITGFTFTDGSLGTVNNNGVVRLPCNANTSAPVLFIRIDHNFFKDLPGKNIETSGWCYGCIDHNYFKIKGNGQPLNVNNGQHGGYSNGDGAWSDFPYFGTEKFVFLEDNTVVGAGSPNSVSGTTDGDIGGKFVTRHSYYKNAHPLGGHGTEGNNRSVRAREGYNNTVFWDFAPGGATTHRGGTSLIHDNVWTAPVGSSLGAGITIYRENAGVGTNCVFGYADGSSPWDKNVTEADGMTFVESHPPYNLPNGFDNGTVDLCEAVGTLDISKNPIIKITDNSKSWTPDNKWVGFSIKQRTPTAPTFTKGSYIIASTLHTITYARYTSTDRGPLMIFATGDIYSIHKCLKAIDQVGAGKCDALLRNNQGVPRREANGLAGYLHSAYEPAYSWNNVVNGSTEMVSGDGGLPTASVGRTGLDIFDLGLNKVGTPTEVSSRYVAALNGVDYTGPYTYPHPLTGVAVPTITSVSSYSPNAGVGGTFQMQTSGFSVAPTFSIITGSLPSGTSLSGGGLLTVGSGTAAGQYQFTVKATHLTEFDTQDFTLTVIASATKIISLTGSGLAFGDVDVNTTGSGSVTISNTGNTVLTVTDLTLPTGYTADWTSGTIAPGANHRVNITFSPLSPIAYNGTLTVVSDKTSGTNTLAITGVGVTRIIGLSGSLAFGDITTGQTATRQLTISNTGNRALNITAASYPTGFSGDFTGAVAAAGSQISNITFAPTLVQAYSGTVDLTSDKTSGTSSKAVSGNGISAPTKIIQLTGSLVFGSIQTGTTSTKVLTLKNSGTALLTVTSITLPTGFTADYSSGTIAAGATQDVNVTFSPVSAISYSGTVTVASDATGGANTTTASGTGVTPATMIISLTSGAGASSIDFGVATIGQSPTRTLKISNGGSAVMTVSGITLPPGFSGSFSGTIAAGASHNVTITFTPTLVQSYDGTITVTSDATSGTNTIPITGSGLAAATRLISLTGDLAFSNVQKNHTAVRILTIVNSGSDVLAVSGITFPTAFSGDWVSGSIPAGTSKDVNVTFAPTAQQTYGGTITVASNKTAGPNTIICSGTGQNKKQVPFFLIVG